MHKDILDVAPQGVAGVSSASERNPSGEESGCQVRVLGAHETADSEFQVAATAGDYSSASQGQYAGSGMGGGVSIPVLSSPLQQFAGERADSPSILRPWTAMTSPAIHSGDTIERLVEIVDIAERGRR